VYLILIILANLGMVYMAEPILEDGSMAPPLELYVVSFQSKYYLSTQGRKKLSQVEQEIKDLKKIRHPKLLTIYAEKLIVPGLSNSHAGPIMPQLLVLMEQAPALTLHDVLEDCESFREDRASVRPFSRMGVISFDLFYLSGLCGANSYRFERSPSQWFAA
jgi:translation initiation factor 2-alpha kinase 4